ncbi:MAG: hypothetical protein V8R49_02880 [Duodenibacillus massiliensis]
MPDLKYFDSRLGEKYSGVPHYFEYASKAIETMFEMVGPVVIGNDGLMKKGAHYPAPGIAQSLAGQLRVPDMDS